MCVEMMHICICLRMAVEVVRLRLWGWKYGSKPLIHAIDIANRVTQIPSFLVRRLCGWSIQNEHRCFYVHASIHTCMQAYIHACMHAYTCIQICMCMYACMCVCIGRLCVFVLHLTLNPDSNPSPLPESLLPLSLQPTEVLSGLQKFCKMTPTTKPKTKASSTANKKPEVGTFSTNKVNEVQQDIRQTAGAKTQEASHPADEQQVRALPGFVQLRSAPQAGLQKGSRLPELNNLISAFKRLRSETSRKMTHASQKSARFRSQGGRHLSLAPFSSSPESIPLPREIRAPKETFPAEPTLAHEGKPQPKMPPSTPVSAAAVKWLQETIPRLFTDVRMEAFVYGNLKSFTPQKLAHVVSRAMPFRNDTLQRNVCPRSQARVSE